jgi:hypothetical protein
MTKFQTELKEAIFEVLEAEKNDLRMNASERKYMCNLAHQHLESLIARCVDKNETEYPPAPGELNIDDYKKALQLACERIQEDGLVIGLDGTPYLTGTIKPEYWIEKAQEGK